MLRLFTYPDDILKQKADDVAEEFLPLLQQALPEMKQMLKNLKGYGLAAPQVGISKSFFIMDLAKMQGNADDAPIICIVNPVIIETSEPIKFEERCFSIPGISVVKDRSSVVELKYRDENWNEKHSIFQGGEAVCCLHEIDHLNGKLLFDGLSQLKATMYKTKYYKKQKRQRSYYGQR